jgi:hypothetical protein
MLFEIGHRRPGSAFFNWKEKKCFPSIHEAELYCRGLSWREEQLLITQVFKEEKQVSP